MKLSDTQKRCIRQIGKQTIKQSGLNWITDRTINVCIRKGLVRRSESIFGHNLYTLTPLGLEQFAEIGKEDNSQNTA